MMSTDAEVFKKFRNIFEDNSKVLGFYRSLNSNQKKKYNPNHLKNNSNLVIDLNIKLDKFNVLVNDIEDLGKDMSDVRFCLKNIMEMDSNVAIYSRLENLYRALSNQYGRYISVKKILFAIKDETDLSITEENLDFFVDFYLSELENLKNNEAFVSDDFAKYIGDFYLVGFELMMREFLIKGESKLYSYFLKTNHDSFIISGFIETQMDSLYKVRDICGLNELERIIDEKRTFFDRDVIIQLIICMYPKTTINVIQRKMTQYKDELKTIYVAFNDCCKKYQNSSINFLEYISKFRKLSKKYKNVLKRYQDFISPYKYLYDGNLVKIKEEINVMTYGMKNTLW